MVPAATSAAGAREAGEHEAPREDAPARRGERGDGIAVTGVEVGGRRAVVHSLAQPRPPRAPDRVDGRGRGFVADPPAALDESPHEVDVLTPLQVRVEAADVVVGRSSHDQRRRRHVGDPAQRAHLGARSDRGRAASAPPRRPRVSAGRPRRQGRSGAPPRRAADRRSGRGARRGSRRSGTTFASIRASSGRSVAVDAAPAGAAGSEPPWVAHDVGAARGDGSHRVGIGRRVVDDGHRRSRAAARQRGREAVDPIVGRDDHVDVGQGVPWPTTLLERRRGRHPRGDERGDVHPTRRRAVRRRSPDRASVNPLRSVAGCGTGRRRAASGPGRSAEPPDRARSSSPPAARDRGQHHRDPPLTRSGLGIGRLTSPATHFVLGGRSRRSPGGGAGVDGQDGAGHAAAVPGRTPRRRARRPRAGSSARPSR